MPKPLTALLIGAGQRGADVYGLYARTHPDQIRFVAVAEPHPNSSPICASAPGYPFNGSKWAALTSCTILPN